MIPVTKPFLPPKEEYDAYLQGIWQRNWLTNNGPLVNELELKLKEYLQVPHMLYLSNGTIALQIAIKALGLKGEVITTPFSYVATTSSIVWEGCSPVFVDIDPQTLNIDPNKIEAAITPRTSGIVATHVYGNPCDVEAINVIAKKHKLKVIYDGAHAFGVKYKGKSIFNYGDVSTASFHATKLYHTVEGGAVVTQDPELLKKLSFMRNFGHEGPDHFAELGINGKNSEFHAAMGLVNVKYIESIVSRRRELVAYYSQKLEPLALQRPQLKTDTVYNYGYYPVLFNNEGDLLAVMRQLELNKIYARRYFYPSLATLPYVSSNDLPVTENIASRVICLPMYYDLSFEEIDFIVRIITRTIKYGIS
ncbi:MAG TPA: DegT/DnrJ/EryC1/StrS family aminotransferase [Cyclobacteriaceae bacterium]|nr:DegT/DnrJ/EryC1/StrS family aminotransferase [Cyclobacteriaceae bacterium]